MAPKKPDSRAKALAGMTKAELVKTIKALDRRQTTLLNKAAPNQAVVDMLILCGEAGGMRGGEAPAVYLRRLLDEMIDLQRRRSSSPGMTRNRANGNANHRAP